MAEEEQEDKESKTEEPSQKKLEDALEKGQFPHSKEVTNALIITTLTVMIAWVLPLVFKYTTLKLKLVIEHAGEIFVDQGQVWNLLNSLLLWALISLSPLFLTIITVLIFATFAQQGRITFSTNSIEPKLSKISVFAGIGRMFSMNNLVEFLKNITKVTLVGTFLYLIISADIKELQLYQDMGIGVVLSHFHAIINHVMICVTITIIVLAAIDYSYQRYEYYQSMRMTKHEQKEEYKQVEGDPVIKKRIRELRMTRAQNNLRKNVPSADVIITNPTHYAIALEYNRSMVAPKVVAKGLDMMALKIREIGEEFEIPIVEDPPLARALYHKVNLSDYVPEEHFEAVAKIIGYVYSLKDKKGG